MSKPLQDMNANTSAPVTYYEKSQGSRQSRPPSRAEKYKQTTSRSVGSSSADRHHNIVKHDCLSKEIKAPTRSQSLPPRPQTRRKLADMPNPNQNSTRARSSGPPSRKGNTQKSRSARSQRSSKTSSTVYAHFSASVKPNSVPETNQVISENFVSIPVPAPRESRTKKRDTSYKNSISNHDYLQFSLRITEDIIRNDLYTNKEMRRVFNSHVEANRGRLDMAKMIEQIDNLCKELNIPSDEANDNNEATRSQIKLTRQNVQSSLACICTPVVQTSGAELKDCECGSVRHLSFQCVQHSSNNTEDATNRSSGMNATQSNHETVIKQNLRSYHDANEDFVETKYYENPEIDLQSSASPILIMENVMYRTNPIYDGSTRSTEILRPSLSSVTERTEPTTSTDTVQSTLETSECNMESSTKFAPSHVLPGFENQEKSEDSKLSTIVACCQSNIVNLGENDINNAMKEVCSSSVHEKQEDSTEETSSASSFWIISSAPIQQLSATQTRPTENAADIPSDSDSKQCSSTENMESSIKCALPEELVKTSPQVKTICSASAKLCTRIECDTKLTHTELLHQTKSEPFEVLDRQPIPTPRCFPNSSHNENLLLCKPLHGSSLNESHIKPNDNIVTNEKSENNSEIPKIQLLQLSETPNIKVLGPNNIEEEFILVPGPIYVPKSSIVPANCKRNQCLSIVAPEALIRKENMLTHSKDAMVNTDEFVLATSNLDNSNSSKKSEESFKVVKQPSSTSHVNSIAISVQQTVSDLGSKSTASTRTASTTFSQLYAPTLSTAHYPSFVSTLSRPPDVPCAEQISESKFFSEKLQQPPKVIVKCKALYHMYRKSSVTTGMDSNTPIFEYNNNVTGHLNDYDLTPERDSNSQTYNKIASATSGYSCCNNTEPLLNQPFIDKENLLLGDEYEIKYEFNKKSSSSSCYDNGLPYAICKFYPNTSTQTQSSDWLIPFETSPDNLEANNVEDDWHWDTTRSTRLCYNDDDLSVKKDTESKAEKKTLSKTSIKRCETFNPPIETSTNVSLKKDIETVCKKERKPSSDVSSERYEIINPLIKPSTNFSIQKSFETVTKEERKRSSEISSEQYETISVNDQFPQQKEDERDVRNESKKEEVLEKGANIVEENDDEDVSHTIFINVLSDDDDNDNSSHIAHDSHENDTEVFSDSDDDNKNANDEADEELQKNVALLTLDIVENDDQLKEIEINDDALLTLDETAPATTPRSSVMLTIDKVRSDLEKFRHTEIPIEQYVKTKYNFAVDQPSVNNFYEAPQQPNVEPAEPDVDVEPAAIPVVQLSDEHLLRKNEPNNEITDVGTRCCGLKKAKKKKRKETTLIELPKMNDKGSIVSNQVFPNRNKHITNDDQPKDSLEYDHLNEFEVPDTLDVRRRQTFDVYSNNLAGPFAKRDHFYDITPTISEEELPSLRNTVVTYRHSIEKPVRDKSNSNVSFSSNIQSIDDDQSALVEILPPSQVEESIVSIPILPNTENDKSFMPQRQQQS